MILFYIQTKDVLSISTSRKVISVANCKVPKLEKKVEISKGQSRILLNFLFNVRSSYLKKILTLNVNFWNPLDHILY